MSPSMENNNEKDIKQLNSFLRGELSAVATYEQCIAKVEEPAVLTQLRALEESHRSRAVLLEERITALGGSPDRTSGAWGSLAKLAEGGAKVFGASAAVSMLEEGEDHGLKDYRKNLDDLTTEQRSFVESRLLPEQKRSHDALSQLQHNV